MAIGFIRVIASNKSWDKVVEAMDDPLMNKPQANKFVRHAVSLIYLIPGYAIFALLKIIFKGVMGKAN